MFAKQSIRLENSSRQESRRDFPNMELHPISQRKERSIRTNTVQFQTVDNLHEQFENSPKLKRSNFMSNRQSQTGPIYQSKLMIKKAFTLNSGKAIGLAQFKDEDLDELLLRNQSSKFTPSLKKNFEEEVKTLTNLLNCPKLSKANIMRELKCLMSHCFLHDSYLMSKRLALVGKQKLKEAQMHYTFKFDYQEFIQLVKKVYDRNIDSQELLTSYQRFLHAHAYPISVNLMIQYFGVYLLQINGNYEGAQSLAKTMMEEMVKHGLTEFIVIYLILMVKMKTNLSQWKQAIYYLTKVISAAWFFQLDDLQIWSYFQLSRCYFSLNNTRACQFFKERSEMSILQPKHTIYRDIKAKQFQSEFSSSHCHTTMLNSLNQISFQLLAQNHPRELSTQPMKVQVHARKIVEKFKIKHVKNLIGRISQKIQKNHEENNYLNNTYAGNPMFLTHESGIKNLNIYFREKTGRRSHNLYTFQNSHKNGVVLKEMLRNMLLQMKHFVPIMG